ncbi:MAG: hypothetical protein AB7N76_17535 [Planctomycetota bacterium]
MSNQATESTYEIGVVYRKGKQLFLAVTNRLLITYKDAALQEVKPQARYDVVRGLSVEELCGEWGIPLSELDETTYRYLAPSREGLKTRPRGTRRKAAADEDSWRQLRTIRLVAG